MPKEAKKVIGRPFPKGVSGNPEGRRIKRKAPPPFQVTPDTLPDERQALAALYNKAINGRQGAVQALKTYLEHSVGKAAQKPPAPRSIVDDLAPETIERLSYAASRIVGKFHCPQCGYQEPARIEAESTGEFKPYTQPPPPKKVSVDAGEDKQVLMRQPPAVTVNEEMEARSRKGGTWPTL